MTDEHRRESDRIERLEQRIERLERERETENGTTGGTSSLSPTRRQMLGVVGAGGLLAGASGSGAAAPGDSDIGNARFVGAGESLQDAVDSSRLVFVTSSYDGSEDPATIDITREVTVIGDGVTKIVGQRDDQPAIRIHTENTRPNEVSLRNLTVTGGSPGILVEDTSFCELSNVNVDYTAGEGLRIANTPSGTTPNSMNLYNTTIENTADGYDGIRVTGAAHSMNLFGVRVLDAGRHGANISRRRDSSGDPVGPGNFTVNINGCQFERSQGYGLRTQGVHGAYINALHHEENKQNPDSSYGGADADICAINCTQFRLDGAYGRVGGAKESRRKSFLYVQNCHTVNVRATRVKNSYEHLIDGSTSSDYRTAQIDCYRTSHYPGYESDIVSSTDIARHVRSHGRAL